MIALLLLLERAIMVAGRAPVTAKIPTTIRKNTANPMSARVRIPSGLLNHEAIASKFIPVKFSK